MIIYLLNKNQATIKAISTKHLIEAKYTEQINAANQLTFSVPLKKRLSKKVFYALFQKPDSSDFLMFKINDESIQNDRIIYTGIDAAYDELKAYGYIKDIRPVKRTALEILQQVLKGTRWEPGNIPTTSPIDTNFYYQNYLDCIQQIAKLFNFELTFTYNFDTRLQRISSRKVNFYLQQGKRTGKRFEYGSNLLEVTREEDSQEIYTALVGRGKGEEQTDEETGEATGGYGRRINFSDVVWSKANGDPADKPAGQEFIEDPEATKVFGYDDGKPRTGIVVFEDIEDPTELLQATWTALKSSERPKASFKANVTDVGNLGLGDTIAIIRHELQIEYFTRVYKVTHDLQNKQNNVIEMGDDLSGNSLTSYVSDIGVTAQQASNQATSASVMANSKNKNYYSTTKPPIADEGDNLFLNLGNGEFEYWVWHNHQWEFVQSTQDLRNVEQNVKQAQQGLNEAKANIEKNRNEANEAITTINQTVTGLTAKVNDSVNHSEFEQLSNQINLKVSKDDILGQINIAAGTTLIQNKKLYFDADSTVFSGKAFIPDAAITNISADKITAGTLDAGKINVININADNIVAGTISGKNVNMNLTTGDIRFTAGRFHNSDDTFDINIDENYFYSENTISTGPWTTSKSSLLIKDGQLQLTQGTRLDQINNPYLKIFRSEGLAFGIVGNALARASVIAGNESIALVQDKFDSNGNEQFLGPFFEQQDEKDNWVQSYLNSDFVGVGVSRPYGTGMFLKKVPFAIYISSGEQQAKIRGKKIIIENNPNNGESYIPRIIVGQEDVPFDLNDSMGKTIHIGAESIYLQEDQSKNSTGFGANVYLDAFGKMYVTTSASRFKQNIKRNYDTTYGNKLLNLPTATWKDKSEVKKYEAGEIDHKPRSYYGMIAEDLDKAGLDMLVTKENGKITGIQYDRIGVALIPVIKELKEKIKRLESKINEQSKCRCK